MIYNCSNLGASIPKLNLEFIVKSTQISRTRPQNENKMKYILNPELCTLEMPFRIRLLTSKLNRWIHGLAVFICSRECSGTGGEMDINNLWKYLLAHMTLNLNILFFSLTLILSWSAYKRCIKWRQNLYLRFNSVYWSIQYWHWTERRAAAVPTKVKLY